MPDATLPQRLATIREQIADACNRSGRTAEDITLLAVSKTCPVTAIREAMTEGLCCFGESRIQEAADKIDQLAQAEVQWHMIGPLQRNKVAKAVGVFDLIHTIDRLSLAQRVDRIAAEHNHVQPVLVQVNIGRETQKHGVDPDDAVAFCRQVAALPHLQLRGLMGIPPRTDHPESSRPYYRQLKQLWQAVEAGPKFDILSMGMSGDYPVAIEEGATLIRVGSALFGPRTTPTPTTV